MRGMIVPSLGGALVSSIGEPADRGLLSTPARVPAVDLAPIVGPTHHKPAGTVTANQREDIELVHPVRMGKNWTAASDTVTVPLVLARPSIAGTRGLRSANLGPHFSIRSNHPTAREVWPLLNRVVPGSPVISVKVVPNEAGGDTRPCFLDCGAP